MRIARRHLLFVTLTAATTLAACSSDKPTGPSSGSLARLFDSAFVADTPGGRLQTLRPQIEQLIAIVADEGLTPTTVQLTTAGSPLSMQMMALTFYDTTAAGTPSDSNAYVVGWTTDFEKYFVLVYSVPTGNGPPAQRLAMTGSLASLGLMAGRDAPRMESVLSGNDGVGFAVDGDSVAQSDSSEGNISWAGNSTRCSWQHVVIAREPADSALTCTHATVTTNFALFFGRKPGVDTSLTRISMSSRAIPAVRLVGLN